MNYQIAQQMFPIWGGFGTGGFTGGGTDDPTGGKGGPRGGKRGSTVYYHGHGGMATDIPYQAPPHYMAWRNLFKPIGWTAGDANMIYRLAKQGRLQLNPEGFQAIIPEAEKIPGGSPWTSPWVNPTGSSPLTHDIQMLKALKLRENLLEMQRQSVQGRNLRTVKRQRGIR